jgi:hypothetical protein
VALQNACEAEANRGFGASTESADLPPAIALAQELLAARGPLHRDALVAALRDQGIALRSTIAESLDERYPTYSSSIRKAG